jgi:serine carboxypeptidase-like clade 2
MTIYANYKMDPRGSMTQLPSLLQQGLKVYLYTGDWDDVVPFTDTYFNLNQMGLRLQGGLAPWLIGDQHAGFIRKYSFGLTVYQVKGAGHEVPLYQRERAFRMF